MRLRWPFQRARSTPRTAVPDGASPSSGASAAGNGEWRSLPPLAETIGPPPVVAPARPFAAALRAGNPPQPILAPLSHGRGLEAPRGLVVGLAKPTVSSSGGSAQMPVQRAPRRPRVDGGVGDVPLEVIEAPTPAAPPAEPIRHLPVASPESRGLPRTLTRSAEPSAAPRPPSGVIGSAIGGPLPLGQVSGPTQRAPLESQAAAPLVPVGSSPGREPDARPAPRGPQPAAASAAASASPARMTIGQARRLGLGAPISSGPTTGLPFGARPAPAPAASSAPEPQRAPAAAPPGLPDLAPRSALASPAAEPARHAASLPGRGGAPVVPADARPARPEVALPVSRAPLVSAAPAGPSSPLVSASPLRPRVQRAPLATGRKAPDESDSATGVVAGSGEASAPSIAGSVTVHRGPAASEMATTLDARAFSHDGQVYLPASHGPLSSGPAKSLLAHELTHVTQQRRLGSNLPLEHSSQGQRLEAEAVAAERGQSLPLAPSAGRASTNESTPLAMALALPENAQRAAIDTRVARPGPEETAIVRLPTAAQRAPMTSAGPDKGNSSTAPEKHRPTERELEDLAGQLYARIGSRLRRELRVDRERAGLLMDRP